LGHGKTSEAKRERRALWLHGLLLALVACVLPFLGTAAGQQIHRNGFEAR